ncbi:SDR family NAD(P)-dependent oxidoreductase [Thalassomonas sp. M1454]|uniref:SDR family NAD(P)-dependent oxidoreductase n=1 Tax=Thalassomonas sp. M1454 TaxID=2594477 RepID=UPI00117C69CB|nr:SDR family oxidoreductase [Thalassomonas sp. M1454]TRX55028.1 SDR family oxidoreductase [Thalassomonas sp. M1454]
MTSLQANNKTVVITGSAGGIGAGMARAFFKRGFNVVLSDLNIQALTQCKISICGDANHQQIHSITCDVTKPEQVQALWQQAIDKFGKIDYWINNAGLGATNKTIAESDLTQLLRINDVNINGVVIGTHVALNRMKAQGGGRIYNTAGMGENGFTRATMVSYGTTKRAVGYFSNGVAKEQQDTNVAIGWLNPGMVITPMVINDAKAMGEKRWRAEGRVMFRLFGQSAENCGEELVKRIVRDKGNGTFIKLLPTYKMIWGFCFNWFKQDKLKSYGI